MVDKARGVGLHDGDGRLQRIGHVHHVHHGAGLDGADEFLAPHRRVEDVNGIVGGAAARRRDVGNDSGEAHRARVGAVFLLEIVAQQLCRHLRYAVDGLRTLNGVLRRAQVGRAQAEGADAAGREYGALLLACHLQDVPQAVDADAPGQARLRLGHHREQGGKVVDGVNMVLLHHLGNHRSVGDIGHRRRAALQEFTVRLGTLDIARHHVAAAIAPTQFPGEFRAYLPGGPNDQDIIHRFLVKIVIKDARRER